MINTKKIFAAVMALAMAIMMASCGDSVSTSENAKAANAAADDLATTVDEDTTADEDATAEETTTEETTVEESAEV